ncbi:hypothetical protein WICPIJ_000235 [Wickerhamomyces pijperi]|uniref:Uncharacterized protein n=1 Tax=Wickerhamomyces pijperi TaxID=599730 RepID=A0A9P8TT11_WICPI|nr:hypothetical protein WICPIJ_000235 [Wickerhamomyces pijperi]
MFKGLMEDLLAESNSLGLLLVSESMYSWMLFVDDNLEFTVFGLVLDAAAAATEEEELFLMVLSVPTMTSVFNPRKCLALFNLSTLMIGRGSLLCAPSEFP